MLARFVNAAADDALCCDLCPRLCVIPSGHWGACGVRGNKNGKGILPFYGHITAMALDPIEKKPLFHFRPGSSILSVGFAGCNLRCPFCQNWRISQNANAPGNSVQPGDIVSAALRENAGHSKDALAIAYTYSEPLVHAEFLLDCMALARHHGIANVLVTNGCANVNDSNGEAAAKEILSLIDAANIDLKCFSAETYAKTLGGGSKDTLETVLAFIRLAVLQGVHAEVTTLVVPGLNDSDEELDACADFIASLERETRTPVPWHLSAYHPDYRWNAGVHGTPSSTDPDFLIQTKERALKKIGYAYTGNTPGKENNTVCPDCGAILVRRRGYIIETPSLKPPQDGERFFRCSRCGEQTAIRW